MSTCDTLLKNATVVNAKGESLPHHTIAIEKGRIKWCGLTEELPQSFLEHAQHIEDCRGNLITPGLIDCHTHLVYAGNRACEFQLKLAGANYEDIARAGGGILSTVKQTRRASEEELLEESLPRIRALQKEGVTTVEIKSGYGLDLETELKMLRVAKQLGHLTGLRVKTTFLGAHAVAPEFKKDSQAYVDHICNSMLPEVKAANLADAVDVFCESIAFSQGQAEQIFNTALKLDLPIKCHAEQLSNIGASMLAAEMGALSCDHLEYLKSEAKRS